MRLSSLFLATLLLIVPDLRAEFTAGAAITSVTPEKLPVLVNGGMRSKSADEISSPVNARSLAFSDGKEKLVLVVVDSCMIPRELIDDVKSIATKEANIPHDRILISATHAHSVPSCMSILGTDADAEYVKFITKQLVKAVVTPLENLKPAQIGWGEIEADDFAALRRWIIHPKFVREDPFGNLTVRANMHAGTDWEKSIGPSGPKDPILSVLSVQTADGKPLAVLANFSMHYYGDKSIGADYYGLFSNGIQEKLDPDNTGFVAMMSHGCSGDVWRHDYEKSSVRGGDARPLEQYASDLADLALKSIDGIKYERPKSIAMAETRMTLAYRVPDKQRLEWAQKISEEVGDRLVETQPEIYAREQIFLDAKKETEVVVQGIRLGDSIAIASTPTETYAITGLKIKAASPAPHTMVIELANGADGYIPPPEQHLFGGYNTWPARSAGLEVNAEPKIAEAAVQMLEAVTKKPRVDRRAKHGPATKLVQSLTPTAYWKLEEFAGPIAVDSSPNGHNATYEPHVTYYLPGVEAKPFAEGGLNRSAHFVGDRLSAQLPTLKGENYSVSLWFWSGTALGIMDETEWVFSRGLPFGSRQLGDHIGLRDEDGKRVLVYEGPKGSTVIADSSSIERWKWHQLTIVREGTTIRCYLDGKATGTVKTESPADRLPDQFYFGGSCTNDINFEGRLDEIAVFDRALNEDEVKKITQLK